MTGRQGQVILAVSLRAGRRVHTTSRYDVTQPAPWDDGPDSPSRTARRLAAHAKTIGGHVLITVVADGVVYGDWKTRTGQWPHDTADAIRQARQDLQEIATT